MLGTIGFEGYCVHCIIGTEPHEREVEQKLLIDLKVEADFSRVLVSESLHDTINYVLLASACKDLAQRGQYFLIEKYASDAVAMILTMFPVKSAWICVKKPAAIPDAECALVELKRKSRR